MTQIDLDWMIRSILDVSIYFVILGIPKLYLERPSKSFFQISILHRYSQVSQDYMFTNEFVYIKR